MQIDKVQYLAFEYIDKTEQIRDPAKLVEILLITLSNFGFTSIIMTGLPQQTKNFSEHTILNGWPEVWYKRYTDRQYYNFDPIAVQARQSTTPFYWPAVATSPDTKMVSNEIMSEAGQFGLCDGLIVPIINANGQRTCISMAGRAIDHRDQVKKAVSLVSMLSHHKATSLHKNAARASLSCCAQLTLREQECLKWIAMGKTDWETSCILTVSSNTVAAHVRSAMRKLSAANRTEAVAKAIAHQHITV
jgi:LuxR family transcriptional regulator, quorum-sensing system regulator BjaR1